MANILEDLLSNVSASDLLQLASINSTGTDLGTGQRNVNLNDPLTYTTVEVEPVVAPLPEGTKLETRGRGLNQRQVLVDEDVGTNAFTHFLKGLADFATFGVHDFDQSGNLFGGEHKKGILPWVGGSGYGKEWDQEEQNKLLEIQQKADLSGDQLPSPEQTDKNLETVAKLDDYAIARLQQLNNIELERFKNAYPQYAKIINDEIYKRVMQAQYNRPDLLQQRMEKSRNNYVNALLARSQAQKNIADAVATGLGRYSGIRNVAG
tara:strand:- start:592 stop:1383 length:792 start_codon:yes stop_codon:yes gene_type:complete